MRALFLALALALPLAACGGTDGGSCPNPPKCTSGKRCGCSCIAKSKTCTKAIEEASYLEAEEG